MLEAGYAPTFAKNPQVLTASKGWQELMEQYLPDESLAVIHAEGLLAKKPIGAKILVDQQGNVVSADTEGVIEVDDYPTRKQYLELAYKIKGKLATDAQINQQFNAQEMTLSFSTDDRQTTPDSA